MWNIRWPPQYIHWDSRLAWRFIPWSELSPIVTIGDNSVHVHLIVYSNVIINYIHYCLLSVLTIGAGLDTTPELFE